VSRVRLDWNCYYRVFPTLDEQRAHQRLAGKVEAPELAADADEATETVDDVDSSAEQDEQLAAVIVPGPPVAAATTRRQRGVTTDVLLPKYRKIPCSAEGLITLAQEAADNRSWSVDISNLQSTSEREFERTRDVILSDPEHLRVEADSDDKIRVPVEALSSESAYSALRQRFPADVLPPWRWHLAVHLRPAPDSGGVVFAFEATNTSPIDTRSWHTDGFFFDVSVTLAFEHATVVPFELEVAPRNFRYDRYLWGRGFNCAVRRGDCVDGTWNFKTVSAPVYAQARYATNTEPPAAFGELATKPVPVLRRILEAMRTYDQQWGITRAQYVGNDPAWEAQHGEEYDRDHGAFVADIDRFERGLRLIEDDADTLLAFTLTNRAFGYSGQKTAWRLFQIVFLVSQITGIHALRSGDASGTQDRNTVDIVYFPTGGGKTEAYLGVIVFHCFFDRLRGKTAGVTTWTRFPLRLLTLQQTQRVADVIGAAELIRASHPDPRLSGPGADGFAVGYFVGDEATPNELTPPRRDEPPNLNWSTASDPEARQRWKKIFKCPACRTSSVVVDFDPSTVRLSHRCSNDGCRFPGGILPVFVVDNEIYRYLPSVVVGTIDKLASLGSQRKLSLVLGHVTGRCEKHGYFSAKCCQKDCFDKKLLRRVPPAGVSGPTLFVQDELHLLREGLGTFDGHYETFLHALLRVSGQEVPVKIIASSATIEAFDRQVRHLYGRPARVFPGHGPTLAESFYATTLAYPQRFYVGVLPHNKTIFNAVLELVTYYHEELETLARLPVTAPNPYGGRCQPGTPEWDALIDLYATSLSYFSSTRELSSIRTDLDTHVNHELETSGFSRLRIEELSGATPSSAVTRILDLLETARPGDTGAPNTILATSMISHGVDIDRFNCMIFYGMPKQTAEYIQSSSRAGRSHVGISFTCLKPARERDQSHFAYFQKYHEFLGQLVEPVAIDRWSKFSIQRTIPGLFMAILLQWIANRSGQDNPNRYYMVDFVKRLISEGTLRPDDFSALLDEAYLIHTWPGPGATAFQEEIARRVRQFMDQILGAGAGADFVSDSLVPKPMRSLRDVDEQIEFELDSNGNAWASRAGR
jgi:hypothetical protein